MLAKPPHLPPDPRADVLYRILRRAGDEALARLGAFRVERKADGTAVTDADLAAHDVLIAGLAESWPDDTLLSEEGPGREGSHGTWFIDPIDGTSAMVGGLAHWGPTVARVVDGRLEVGAIWVPRLQELWFAADGQGAWRNSTRLTPPDAPVTRESVLFVPSRAHHVGPLPWRGKTRALGSTAIHLALVAAGLGDGVIVPSYKPWDVGAGVLLVQEAGRSLTDLSGDPLDPMSTFAPFVAAAPSALHPLLEAVRHALEPQLRT